jgi:anti-sigma regulatory factor (Ser/Thr protein kinase)
MPAAGRPSRRVSIRQKLIVALVPPLVVLATVIGFEVREALVEVGRVDRQAQLVEAALGPLGLLNGLERERNAAGIYLLGLEDAVTLEVEDNAEARRQTDAAAGQLRERIEELDAWVTDAFAPGLAGLEQLAGAREQVDAYTGPRDLTNVPLTNSVFEEYNAVVDDVYAANQEVAFAIEDATTRHGAQLAALSSQQTDLIARLVRELLLAAAGGDAPDGLNDPTEIGNVTTLLDSLRANEAQLRARGRGPYRPLVDTLLASDEVTVFPGIVQRALATGEVDLGGALAAATGGSGESDYTVFREAVAAALQDRARDHQDEVTAEARRLGVLAAVTTVLALIVTWLVARSIIRSLGDLTRQATDLARRRLPQAVRGILERPLGEDVAVPEMQAIRIRATDESLDVASALTTVQDTAVRLAVEQAVLRRNSADSFLSMGRRFQNLLSRQLEFITHLESAETNPDSLGNLFHLDHLATRMRRNAESLLVLTGVDPPRRWRSPVPIGDVIRAAVGEVEQFARVAVRNVAPVTVDGAAASDLAHLLAELIENALTHSPPEDAVHIRGAPAGSSYRLAVVDHGFGMHPEDMARANRRLSGAEPPTVAPSRALGHYVAGHLAARHRVEIRLGVTPGGGVTAVLDLPGELIVRASGPADGPITPLPLAAAHGGGRRGRP